MKIVKRILLVIVILVAIPLIIALFISKEVTIEREVVVNKPKQQVFDYVKMLKNQDNFSVWNMTDPNMKKEYAGTDGTVGFVYKWDSENKNVGKGEQSIAKIDEGNRVDFNLHFIKPWDGLATAYMTTESTGENQTKVKWAFHNTMPYPMNIMKLMGMENQLGDALQSGLNNLKGVLEK